MSLPESTVRLLDHLGALTNMMRRVAIGAGDIIMEHYDESGYQGEIIRKPDNSPVTAADLAADAFIQDEIAAACPGIPIVTEETVEQVDHQALGQSPYYWLVDPLDGTREFKRGSREFTVNIALVQNHQPILGIIYAPALGVGYGGHRDGGTLQWATDRDDKELKVRDPQAGGLSVVLSPLERQKKQTDDFLDQMKIEKRLYRGSSIKFCDVAAGKADLYPRFSPTYYWDTAAGHAILNAAGGHVLDLSGAPLRYNPAGLRFENPHFVACADCDLLVPVLEEIKKYYSFQ